MAKPQRRNDSNTGRNQGTKAEQRETYREKMARNAHAKAGRSEVSDNVVPINIRKPLDYLTENQRLLGCSIRVNTCTFATGPAGTGKTHIAIAEQLPMLFKDKSFKMVLTNPAVEIGSPLGILPGDKDEKISGFVRPLRDILTKILGASHLENLVGNGRIMFESLGSILGTTFDDAMIVLDEAQNSTPAQMKALLTRVGQRSKIVIAGDAFEQKFIDGTSGLEDALKRIGHLSGVGQVDFTADDIIRSGFCKDVILAYRENNN
jgi:phosphate starvation-inducible PhoH-like protein